MICLSKNEHGADLLAAYLAKTLDASGRAELDRHVEECADCRGLMSVWERLDEFAVPDISPGFDARLYARIAAEESRRSRWRRWLWRPAVPLAAAGAVAALALFAIHVPRNADTPQHASKAEIEQVAQAVDDLDLLIPLSNTR